MKPIAKATLVAVLVLFAPIRIAVALELNQAIENCRASVGKPIVMDCMRGGGNLEACRERATPKVKACVRSTMIAARPKQELFDAAKVSAPKPEEAAANAAALASAPVTLVAPPRTISDVTAILDAQKPDTVKVAELTATADAPVPDGLKGLGLADFYYRRAQARGLLGRGDDALADAELAVSNGQGSDYAKAGSRHEQLLMRRLREAGQYKRASTILAKQTAAFANKGKGKLFGLNYQAAVGYIRNGDINAAETAIARNRSLLAEAQRWPNFSIYGQSWQALVEDGAARVAEARGRFADAEAAYHKASIFYLSSLKTVSQWESRPAEGELERSADWALALEGRVKVKQGRVGEGEADVRRALLSRLSKSGKFHVDTAGVLGVLVYRHSGAGTLSGGRATAAPSDQYLSGARLRCRFRRDGQCRRLSWLRFSTFSGSTTRPASFTTRSMFGRRSGNRRVAKPSTAGWRASPSCCSSEIMRTLWKLPSAHSTASAPNRATRASIPPLHAVTWRWRWPVIRSRRKRCRHSRNRSRYC